jgi:xylan 1,4-beta-xylosidase
MPFPQDYMALYNASAVAIKSVDERLMVGGPATMQVHDVIRVEMVKHFWR